VALARASLAQAKASLELAQRDLDRCTITAPIDGFVLRRLVSVGEPVVSALTAQHLFVITPDLSHMQLHANVGESDIGLVQKGQKAEFTVDACGERTFTGTVTLVRNDPVTLQGVVTYPVLIEVANVEGLLKPEMTASVSIEVVQRDDALKISNAALRFRPGGEAAVMQELTAGVSWPPVEDLRIGGAGVPVWAGKTLLWTMQQGRPRPAPVWIGITDGRETEILSGAAAGERFITSLISRGGVVGSVKHALEMANPGNRSL
jgi:HlyD family secretion protein